MTTTNSRATVWLLCIVYEEEVTPIRGDGPSPKIIETRETLAFSTRKKAEAWAKRHAHEWGIPSLDDPQHNDRQWLGETGFMTLDSVVVDA